MRNFLFVAWLIVFSFASFSQGPAHFKVADNGAGIEQVLSSFNGYLTLGCDSISNRYMVKWDNFFNPVWKLCFTDSRICGIGSQMIEAPDGSIYYATTTSFSTSTVVFLDTAYNLVSAGKLSPGVQQFLLTDLVSTPSGNAMIACGRIYRGSPSAWEDGVVLKMDRNGNMEWFNLPKPFNNGQNGKGISLLSMMMKNNRLFAGAGSSDGATITILDTNGIGFCNAIDTTFQLGNLFFTVEDTLIVNKIHTPSDSTANLAYNRLVYINKFEYCGTMPGVASRQRSLSPVSVYPVPAKGYFVADPGEEEHEAIPFRILDIHGKQLMAGMISGPQVISTTQWKSGVYLLQVQHHGQWSSVKFMITNP